MSMRTYILHEAMKRTSIRGRAVVLQEMQSCAAESIELFKLHGVIYDLRTANKSNQLAAGYKCVGR